MLNVQVSTVVFQVLNFLVLLAVLRWFFYRPVLGIMKSRQAAIADKLREAEERSRQAESERLALAEQSRQAQAKAEELLAMAQADAAKTAQQVVEKAHAEAIQLLDETRLSVAEAERTALDQAEAAVREAALTMAGNLIRQAAGPAVHAQLLERLLSGGGHAQPLSEALSRSQTVTVEVAYPAGQDEQTRIVERLAHAAGFDPGQMSATFRTEPELLAGARVLSKDFVLDLTLRRTLRDLMSAAVPQPAEVSAV